MKTENLIVDKSFQFAVRVVRLCKHLSSAKKEFVLSKQLLRSGTSVGANVSEAIQGSSKKDFVHKMSISLKEAQETLYWLRLLQATDYLDENEFNSISTDCVELIRILTAILNTSKGQT